MSEEIEPTSSGETIRVPSHTIIQVASDRRFSMTVEAPVYLLERADFMILKTCDARAKAWAVAALSATVGIAFPIAARSIDAWMNGLPIALTSLEKISLLVPFATSVVCFIAGRLLPNERRTLCARIASHFKENPSRASQGDRS